MLEFWILRVFLRIGTIRGVAVHSTSRVWTFRRLDSKGGLWTVEVESGNKNWTRVRSRLYTSFPSPPSVQRRCHGVPVEGVDHQGLRHCSLRPWISGSWCLGGRDEMDPSRRPV